jgi:hypothetical protein
MNKNDDLQRIWRPALLAVLLIAACGGAPALAKDLPPFDPALPAGSRCTVAIAPLRPTQFAVGFWEVDRRAEHIASRSPKKLKAYLEEHTGAIVIGPGGVPFLVDGHHLACAMLKSHRGDAIEVRVEANLRDLPPERFWAKMKERGWLYLYDQQGKGPIDPDKLPKRVQDLADDPYRSLAWAVRERGGYKKSLASFAEFQWAEFFRPRIALGNKPGDFDRATEAAMKIVHSPEAKNLPGYIYIPLE